MAEQKKNPATQQKKRPRLTENTASSGGKKSSSVLPVTCIPAATLALGTPSPAGMGAPALAAPSPVAKAKPAATVVKAKQPGTVGVTSPVAATAPAAHAAPIPAATRTTPALKAPSPVAKAKPTATVAVASPVADTAPAALAAPSPAAARTTPALTAPSPVAKAKPPATMLVTIPVAVADTAQAALAATSPAATRATPAQTAPSPNATANRIAGAEPEDGGVLEEQGGAMAVMAVEVLNLDLKKNLKWVQCAACLSALKSPIFMCENGHTVCSACGNGDAGEKRHCRACGRDVAFTHLPCMDGLLGALESPCPYRKFGCGMSIAYQDLAEHVAACAHAPCYCLECTPPFQGSPAGLVRHLTDKSGRHRWPANEIKYGEDKWFVMRVSSSESDHRHPLVAEDGCVFLLAVDAIRPSAGRLPVTVVCVKGNAKPVYRGTLTVQGPWDEDEDDDCSELTVEDHRDTFKLNAKMASCAVPAKVDMEHGRLNAHVNRELLHGDDDSLKVHLSICITKIP